MAAIRMHRRPARPAVPGWVWTVFSLAAALGLWAAAPRLVHVDPIYLPPPDAVAMAIWRGFASGLFLDHLAVTVAEITLGFLIAAAAGISIGTLIAQSQLIERTVQPLIVALQSTPKIALAPLVIIWFGYGIASKVVLVAVIASFPILVSTVAGLSRCDPGRLDVMRSLRASRWQIFRMVRFPSALPLIFAGLDVAAVFVVIGAIVGEFVGAKAGMGILILNANTNMDTAVVFAIIAVLAAIGLSFHRAVQWLRRRIVYWAPAEGR